MSCNLQQYFWIAVLKKELDRNIQFIEQYVEIIEKDKVEVEYQKWHETGFNQRD